MTEPELILEALYILGAPNSQEKTAATSSDTFESRFQTMLAENVKSAEAFLYEKGLHLPTPDEIHAWSDACSLDVKWKFVETNLKLLHSLKMSLTKAMDMYASKVQETMGGSNPPPLSPDTLSVKQQKTVLSTLQFIIGLGVVPNLLPGVGIPLSRRSGFSHLVQAATEQIEDALLKERRLKTCLWVLMSCVTQSALGSLILTRHLGDLLAALCQVCYGPKQSNDTQSKAAANTNKKNDTDLEAADSLKGGSMCLMSEDYWRGRLDQLVEKIYQPMLVKELLLLQGGTPTQAKSKAGGSGEMLTRAPAWLRRCCGRFLSQALMKPHGVKLVLQGMFHGMGVGSGVAAQDWKKCDAVAKVIAHCPKNFITPHCYYSAIAPQILELVHENDSQLAKQYLRVAVSTVVAMVTMHPSAAQEEVVSKLLYPLLCCGADRDIPMDTSGVMVVCERSLSQCVEAVHKVFVTVGDSAFVLLKYLQPVIHSVFMLYCFTKTTVSHLRSVVEEILLVYLRHMDEDVSLSSLQLMTYAGLTLSAHSAGVIPLHAALTFKIGSTGGVYVMTDITDIRSSMVDWERRAQCITDLLAKLQSDAVVAQFFLILLQELTSIISKEVKTDTAAGRGDADDEQVWLDVQKNLLTLTLLSQMCEKLGHECFKNTCHILNFVQVTLERGVEVLCNTTDDVLGEFESETLTMAMGLLVAVLEDPRKISKEDREKTKELLPLLEDISRNHTSIEVREMASDLRIAIATHGLVQSDLLKEKNVRLKADSEKKDAKESIKIGEDGQKKADEKKVAAKPKLIEVISSDEENRADKDASQTAEKAYAQKPPESTDLQNDKIEERGPEYSDKNNTEKGKEIDQDASKYQQALSELMDPLLPVRGHALISLHQLVRSRDPETLSNQDTVLEIFRENLKHHDSYIYLASIQGLVNLADCIPDKIVPLLAEEYASFSSEENPAKDSVELNVKIGEALTKASRCLGEMLPHYRDVLLNSVLRVTRDNDAHVRASAVSNLCEICKLLRFSLGPVLHEVVMCVKSLLTSDTDMVVRWAAATVITMLFRGLGADSLEVLGDVIKDLYRLLRHVVETEKNEVMRLHVQLALDELKLFMKKFLFPPESLTKKIHIRQLPS